MKKDCWMEGGGQHGKTKGDKKGKHGKKALSEVGKLGVSPELVKQLKAVLDAAGGSPKTAVGPTQEAAGKQQQQQQQPNTQYAMVPYQSPSPATRPLTNIWSVPFPGFESDDEQFF